MRILLYEHASSGGLVGEPIPSNLLSEGYAMLRGLASDFKEAGHEVTVLLDSRIAQFNPPIQADHLVIIAPSGEVDPSMEKASETVDAAYAIAPESGHTLQSIVECIETTGTFSLNCQASGIELASDKAALGDRLRKLALHSPKTEFFEAKDSPVEIAQAIKSKLGFPVIMKPSSSAGCCGLSLIQNQKQVTGAISKIKREAACDSFIAQEMIKGVPVSVSLISTGDEALPISLNFQNIALYGSEGTSAYVGGMVPFSHPLRDVAFDASQKLVQSFKNLRGYVGVDMILSDDKVFVIEINPRLTTSYVGLRKIANFNLTETILKAVIKNDLPKKPKLKNGYACFSKVPVCHIGQSALQKTFTMDEFVAPPFPVSEGDLQFALVQACADSPNRASMRICEIMDNIQQTCQGD